MLIFFIDYFDISPPLSQMSFTLSLHYAVSISVYITHCHYAISRHIFSPRWLLSPPLLPPPPPPMPRAFRFRRRQP
jgi:hypothetical protein